MKRLQAQKFRDSRVEKVNIPSNMSKDDLDWNAQPVTPSHV